MIVLFDGMGMLNQADGDLLEIYCVTYSGYRQALDSVNKRGQVLVLNKGGKQLEVRRNPYCVELHKHIDRLAKLMAEMGLTASSRLRVAAAGDGDDELLEYLRGHPSAN